MAEIKLYDTRSEEFKRDFPLCTPEYLEAIAPHICTPETCPEGDDYFVSAIDAGRTYYMAGPYLTHAGALAAKPLALEIANKHDGRAWFMSWGTVRLAANSGRIGALNRVNLL